MSPHRALSAFLGQTPRKTCLVMTGAHCPMTGWWMPAGQDQDLVLIAEGNVMPAKHGKPVLWSVVPTVPFLPPVPVPT